MINNNEHTKDREKEVLNLCKAVLDMSPNRYYNSNGPDESCCPMCFASGNVEADISEIPHKPDCGYLIAKDLTTNVATL